MARSFALAALLVAVLAAVRAGNASDGIRRARPGAPH